MGADAERDGGVQQRLRYWRSVPRPQTELAESWPLQFMAVSLKPVGSLLVDST
jgi:hypothetical protein